MYCNDFVLVSGLEAKFERENNKTADPPWQNRAWTLQEQLLSTRCVIFESNQVHWECMEASYCEETEFEPFTHGTIPGLSSSRSLLPFRLINQSGKKPLTFQAETHRQYQALVRTYSRRELSIDSDALNAFQGILSMLSDCTGIAFFWGHPIPLFEQHLFWSASAGRSRSCPEFPSWSWIRYQFSFAPSDNLSEYAAVRCYTTVDESLDQSVLIKPVNSGDGYRIRGSHLESRRPSARIVNLEDVPLLVLNQIQVNLHILFWADTIKDKSDEPCGRSIGSATCNGYCPDDQDAWNCELVKILDVVTHANTDYSSSTRTRSSHSRGARYCQTSWPSRYKLTAI